MPEYKATDYLAQEYLFLQKTVEEFDARALTIKAWSVTFSAAGLGLAYQQHNPVLLLLASGSALSFWVLEVVWKFYQRAFYPRILKIERLFTKLYDDDPTTAPFQISSRWELEPRIGYVPKFRQIGRPSRPLAVLYLPGVLLPHILVFAAGLLLYIYAPPA